MSDLRLPRRARRPVRQLRQPARPDRPDQPPQQDQRRDAGVRGDAALLPRPAGARRRADVVRREPRGRRHLAPQRHQVLPQPDRGPPAAGDDPRHRLGHPGPGRRLARQPDQTALRLVRRGDRLPVGLDRVGAAQRRPRAVARVVERPGGALLLLHGQGQHRLPLRDLARRAPGVRREGRAGRRARTVRRAPAAHGDRVERVHDDGEQAVLHQPRPRDPGRRHAVAVPARRAALLPVCRRTGDVGLRLHLGRLRAAHQLRAGRRAGATSSTAPRR